MERHVHSTRHRASWPQIKQHSTIDQMAADSQQQQQQRWRPPSLTQLRRGSVWTLECA